MTRASLREYAAVQRERHRTARVESRSSNSFVQGASRTVRRTSPGAGSLPDTGAFHARDTRAVAACVLAAGPVEKGNPSFPPRPVPGRSACPSRGTSRSPCRGAERRVAGADGVVLLGQWGAEERHDAVAHHLVHRALIAVHGLPHALQHRVQQLACLLRVALGEQLQRALEVREEHGDLLAFPLERALRGQDLLDEVPGRVGVGRAEARLGGRGSGGRARTWGRTSPSGRPGSRSGRRSGGAERRTRRRTSPRAGSRGDTGNRACRGLQAGPSVQAARWAEINSTNRSAPASDRGLDSRGWRR